MPLDCVSAADYLSSGLRVLLHGNNGTGKSITALTASRQCPAWLDATVKPAPADAKPVTLSDMAYLGVDSGALRGAAEIKVWPKYFIDASSKEPYQIAEYLIGQIKELAPLCAKGEISTVVLDTASMLDVIFEAKHSSIEDNNKKAAAKLRDHARVFGPLHALKADVIVLCHTKATFDVNEEATKRRLQRGLPTYIPKIGGSALDFYQNDMDFIFAVSRKRETFNGKPVEKIRWSTTTALDVQAKSRIQAIPAEMPADFRELRKYLASAPEVSF